MEAKVKVEEEVAVLSEEGVDSTTKFHTNLRECIMDLILKVESIPTMIGRSPVANSVVQCTKIICKMYGFISELHHQDLVSITKDGISSTRPL